MRRLTIIVAVLAALYSGYWFVGARAAENGARSGIADAVAQGWEVAFTDLSTRGFPSRFDTTVTELEIATPDRWLRYATPFAQVFALSYAPNEVIAALADRHDITLGQLPLTVTTDGLRASARVAANTELSFESATAEVGAMTVQIAQGPILRLTSALAASRQVPEAANTYQFYFEALGLTLPDAVMSLLAPNDDLSATMPRIAVDASAAFDAPLDRHALAQTRAISAVGVQSFDVQWGDMRLTGTGDVVPDARGYAEGKVTLQATNWRSILGLLVNGGLVDPEVAPTWEAMGDALSNEQPTLELPVSFSGGIARIGLFPIGPAPQLRKLP